MRRRNRTGGGADWRLGLILLLLAALWPLSLRAEAPIGRFVIGVWSPAGWSGAKLDSYDRFFRQSDANFLNELGVNLLVQTPRIGGKDIADFEDETSGRVRQDAHEILQDLEQVIIDSFKTYGGLVVEQSADEELDEEDPEPGGPTTYTSRVPFGDRLIDYAGTSQTIDEHKLEQQAIALSDKWGGTEYVDGFFGYFIGHERYPNWYRSYRGGGWQGGIYNSNTYTNLGKVIDAIRERDTTRAIVAVGSVHDTETWTDAEQTEFRQKFFRLNSALGPANILMNEQYIFNCGTDSEDEVQTELEKLIGSGGSLDRTRNMVVKARSEERKAEWHHIINVNNEYRLGDFEYENGELKRDRNGDPIWIPNACWAGTKGTAGGTVPIQFPPSSPT